MPTDLFRIATDRTRLVWSLVGMNRSAIGPALPATVHLVPGTDVVFRETWPSEDAAANFSATSLLFEETEYSIFAESLNEEPIVIRHRDPTLTRGLASRKGGLVWYGPINFGGDVGLSRFDIVVGNRLEFSLLVEVFPSKLDYQTDYLSLLRDVRSISTGLALEFLRSTFRLGSVEQRPGRTDIEWVDLLLWLVDDLDRAIRQIERYPHRTLLAESERTRVDRVRRVDSAVRRSVLRHGLTGTMPEYVDALPRRLSYRNPENGWIAIQLHAAARKLTWLLNDLRLSAQTPKRLAEVAELGSLADRVGRLRRSEPIAAAAEVTLPTNYASLQLLSLPGYREAYLTLLMLRLGLGLEGDSLHLTTKELNVLYEYWCYLTTILTLKTELGTGPDLGDLFQLSTSGLSIRLQAGRETRVKYTHQGRRIQATYNPLYSVGLLTSQRPDITVEIDDPGWPRVLMVLDAKYRIDASPKYVARYGVPGPPEDAINVLHRYRDAVLETAAPFSLKRSVVQGAAIYPYAEPVDGVFVRSRLWTALGSLGIGAIPALPSDSRYLRLWVRDVLRHGGWELADLAIPHAVTERADYWRYAQEQQVLVLSESVVPSDENLFAAVPARAPSSFAQLASCRRVIVATEPKPGDWEVVAERVVRAVSPRLDQVLLELGPRVSRSPLRWRHADLPLRPPFMTTALAAERALTAPELLLRTETEWRLREQLTVVGLEVAFEVIREEPLLPELLWLVGPARARITQASDGGFLLRRHDGTQRPISTIEEVLMELARIQSAARNDPR